MSMQLIAESTERIVGDRSPRSLDRGGLHLPGDGGWNLVLARCLSSVAGVTSDWRIGYSCSCPERLLRHEHSVLHVFRRKHQDDDSAILQSCSSLHYHRHYRGSIAPSMNCSSAFGRRNARGTR